MTMLERFIAFTRDLPADRQIAVEEAMAAIMASHKRDVEFTDAELGELDRRVAEPKRGYAAAEDIEILLGKRFST